MTDSRPETFDRAADRGLGPDLLRGADEIAEFLLGGRDKRRTIYELVRKGRLPVFRIGHSICARRSVLTAWIGEQERSGGAERLFMQPRSPDGSDRGRHEPLAGSTGVSSSSAQISSSIGTSSSGGSSSGKTCTSEAGAGTIFAGGKGFAPRLDRSICS